MVSLISRPVLALCLPIFLTMRDSQGMFSFPAHLFISSCNPFTSLLSCNSFMQVSKKVVNIEGSIYSVGLSWLPEVEASTKLFFASINVSCARSRSNSTSFYGALRTHILSSDYFPLSSTIVTTLYSPIFTFGSSLRGSGLIIYKFWVGCGGCAPFSHILANSTGKYLVLWSNLVQYRHEKCVRLVHSHP